MSAAARTNADTDTHATLASVQALPAMQMPSGVPPPSVEPSPFGADSHTEWMNLHLQLAKMRMRMNSTPLVPLSTQSLAFDSGMSRGMLDHRVDDLTGRLDRTCSNLDRVCGNLDRVCNNLDGVCSNLGRVCNSLERACGSLDSACGALINTCNRLDNAIGHVAAAAPIPEAKVARIEDAASASEGVPEDLHADLAANGEAAAP